MDGENSSPIGAKHSESAPEVETRGGTSSSWIYITRRDIILVSTVSVAIVLSIAFNLYVGLPLLPIHNAAYQNFTQPVSNKQPLRYNRSIVATNTQYCATVGKNILATHGTAVDAAIAAFLCSMVVDVHLVGLGGSSYIAVYSQNTSKTQLFNGFSTNRSIASRITNAGESIAVPGSFGALWKAFTLFGSKTLKELVEPTLDLCKRPIPITKSLAHFLKRHYNDVVRNKVLHEMFVDPAGKTMVEGNSYQCNKALIKTLTELASSDNPMKEFYRGTISSNILKDIREHGSVLTEDDFGSFEAFEEDLINIPVSKNVVLCTPPPPSLGGLVGMILKLMGTASYNGSLSLKETVSMYHHFVESSKHTFAHMQRFVESPSLFNDQFFLDIESRITEDRTQQPEYYLQKPFRDVDETHELFSSSHHVIVVSKQGDAVVMSSSLNSVFGSTVVSPSTGIIMNNAMLPEGVRHDDAVVKEGNLGEFRYTTLSPAIILSEEDMSLRAIIGGSYGKRAITTQAMVLFNYFMLGQSLKYSVDSKRLHHQLQPNTLLAEDGFPRILLDKLHDKGHWLQRDVRKLMAGVSFVVKNASMNVESILDFRDIGSIDGF